jgi:hypothetical protein
MLFALSTHEPVCDFFQICVVGESVIDYLIDIADEVRVVAGNGLRGSHVVQALMDPFGLAVDSKGRLLISCLEGYTILRFDESAPKNKQLDCIAGSNARVCLLQK